MFMTNTTMPIKRSYAHLTIVAGGNSVVKAASLTPGNTTKSKGTSHFEMNIVIACP